MAHLTRTARVLLALSALAAVADPAQAQQSVIVVRHAERQDDTADSPLSDAGRARAERLATVLKDADVSAVYVSQWLRTQQTAAPLARAQGLTPVVVASNAVDALVRDLRAKHKEDVVLVVAHSDTSPKILAALGVTEPVEIGHHDYDNMFIVIPRAGLPPKLMHMRY